MTMDLTEVIADVRATGRGRDVCCPAHDDRQASLSVGLGRDDRALIDCKAGCETPAVLEAAGLKMRDLFAGNGNGHRPRSVGPPRSAEDPDRNDLIGQELRARVGPETRPLKFLNPHRF